MLKQMEGLEITGIMSTPRGLERTRELAARYGIPHAVADFQELLSVFDRDDLTEFQYIPHHGAWDVQIR